MLFIEGVTVADGVIEAVDVGVRVVDEVELCVTELVDERDEETEDVALGVTEIVDENEAVEVVEKGGIAAN